MQKLIFLIVYFIISYSAQAQLTLKDFKLCLDNAKCTDTVLLMTKDELLSSKQIIPNYSWFTIDSAVVYVGEGNYSSEMIIVNLPTSQFNGETRKIFKRLKSGDSVAVAVRGHNKQNSPVDWGTLFIKIIEKRN
ncbi:MAG: hypothetical protein JWQ27_378 [Ferruginibacter sp.]|nr:hypothetical protein [Ferruginibacter sp.]